MRTRSKALMGRREREPKQAHGTRRPRARLAASSSEKATISSAAAAADHGRTRPATSTPPNPSSTQGSGGMAQPGVPSATAFGRHPRSASFAAPAHQEHRPQHGARNPPGPGAPHCDQHAGDE